MSTLPAATALPLFAPRDRAAPIAWHAGTPISGAQFMADVLALAERLPDGTPVNLCNQRYRFTVAFAAALLRGQTSLFPPNALPETLARLGRTQRDLHALIDDDTDTAGLHAVRVEAAGVGTTPVDVPSVKADAIATCLLTSGSTGDPTPHAKRWATWWSNVQAASARLAETIDRPSLAGLNIVATVPPQHSYGFESSVLLALLGGAAFDSGRPFYPADIVRALEQVPRPRALVTTPFHLKTLLLAGLALPPVDLVLSATAPLSPQSAAEAERRFGAPLIEIYGCTEAGQVATRRTTAGEIWRTFGALRVHAERDPDGERFIVQGGHVAQPTPLADVLELVDAQHFRLLGRANDLIHVAGKRSSLAHLNFHLNRIDGVHDGAFWLPDETAEAVVRPVAFVVAPRLSAPQIIGALREHLEPAFVPRRVVHVDALPREATGKLTAQALRRFALERLGASR